MRMIDVFQCSKHCITNVGIHTSFAVNREQPEPESIRL